MEGIENIGQEGNVVLFVNEQAKRSLAETAKWSKLLSIVGFVGIGFIILLAVFMALFMGSVSDLSPELAGMGGMMGVGMSVFYLFIAAIYFYPVWKLYQFAILTKSALNSENPELLANAFEAQKSMFKFMGIFTIIILGIYGLMFAIFGTALLGSMF
jgi:hypothetical protein